MLSRIWGFCVTDVFCLSKRPDKKGKYCFRNTYIFIFQDTKIFITQVLGHWMFTVILEVISTLFLLKLAKWRVSSSTWLNCMKLVSYRPFNPHCKAFCGKYLNLYYHIIYIWGKLGPKTVIVVLLLASRVLHKSSTLKNLSQINE